MKLLVLVALIVSGLKHSSVAAQHSPANHNDTTLPDLRRWLLAEIVMLPPDTGFVLMEDANGYVNEQMHASLRYITLPGSFDKLMADIRGFKNKSYKIVDTLLLNQNERRTVTMIYEAASPNALSDAPYLLTTAIEYNDVLVVVNGIYPRSMDKALRQRFLDASRSVTLVPLPE